MALTREQVEVLNLFDGKFYATSSWGSSPDSGSARRLKDVMWELRRMRLVVLVDQTTIGDVWMITRCGKAARGMNQGWRELGDDGMQFG